MIIEDQHFTEILFLYFGVVSDYSQEVFCWNILLVRIPLITEATPGEIKKIWLWGQNQDSSSGFSKHTVRFETKVAKSKADSLYYDLSSNIYYPCNFVPVT